MRKNDSKFTSTSYKQFLENKQQSAKPVGFKVKEKDLPESLFNFQNASVRWALRIGRAALFFDVGLGKTSMQLSWADAVVKKTDKPVLILAPLIVGPQTCREAIKFNIPNVQIAESKDDIKEPRVYVTNYHKLHRFDVSAFSGVALDESGILKSFTGSTCQTLIQSFSETPYRLACSATPSPNDHEELGNHAEFLGVMTRTEMLATWFLHDSANTGDWRLKGHAEKDFWEWVASWAMVCRKPSDLGFEMAGYDLPKLNIIEHVIDTELKQDGRLFAVPEETLEGQRKARRQTMSARITKAAEIVAKDDRQCVIWCELNDEGDEVEKAIPDCVQIAGRDTDEAKENRMIGFLDGEHKCLVSKAKICGFGVNMQICSKTIIVGATHSFEQFYQLIGRFRRFGQTKEVDCHVITSDLEYSIFQNVKAKWAKHDEMFGQMVKYTSKINRESLGETKKMSDHYKTAKAKGDNWTMILGDSCEVVAAMPSESIHYSIFSPPFASLYTYSNSPRDMGNCSDEDQFFVHFDNLIPELYRVLKPGRLLSFHCMDMPTSKERDGFIGLKDFRGDLIKAFQKHGFILHSQVCIWKDPVTVMQRTKALGLLHKQIKKDSCMSRQGIPDYLVTMRKPGENPERVEGRFESFAGTDGPEPIRDANNEKQLERFSVEVWQRYASPVWMDINQTHVLNNYREGRDEKDERHICPLQLDVIERCVDMWSNPGDVVLSPFGGIGSEGYQSILQGRKFIGVELKPGYFKVACKNLERAEKKAKQSDLFTEVVDEPELAE